MALFLRNGYLGDDAVVAAENVAADVKVFYSQIVGYPHRYRSRSSEFSRMVYEIGFRRKDATMIPGKNNLRPSSFVLCPQNAWEARRCWNDATDGDDDVAVETFVVKILYRDHDKDDDGDGDDDKIRSGQTLRRLLRIPSISNHLCVHTLLHIPSLVNKLCHCNSLDDPHP